MSNWHRTGLLARSRAPEAIGAFEVLRRVDHIRSIPHDCLCTWVPTWELRLPAWPANYPYRTQQPGYQVTGMELKFVNGFCPVRSHCR